MVLVRLSHSVLVWRHGVATFGAVTHRSDRSAGGKETSATNAASPLPTPRLVTASSGSRGRPSLANSRCRGVNLKNGDPSGDSNENVTARQGEGEACDQRPPLTNFRERARAVARTRGRRWSTSKASFSRQRTQRARPRHAPLRRVLPTIRRTKSSVVNGFIWPPWLRCALHGLARALMTPRSRGSVATSCKASHGPRGFVSNGPGHSKASATAA
jgi:hypothetical protein